MRQHRLFQVLALTGILFIFCMPFALAQDSNLLINPGFERNYPNFEGDQPRNVAEGWMPWNAENTDTMPSFQNAQPRYVSTARTANIPDRIRSGGDAQVYYSFFETHDAGVYQQVAGITPGTQLTFSVFVYVWSSTFNDTDLSEDPGDVSVAIGIDPTGGTDPLSNDVIYSPSGIAYDGYQEYRVSTQANADTVTVFVRSTVGLPVQNTYIHLDDAVLQAEAEPATAVLPATQVPADATPTVEGSVPTEEPSEEPEGSVPTEETSEEPTDDPAIQPTEEPTAIPPTETPVPPTETPVPPTEEPTAIPPTEEPTTDPIAAEFPGTVAHVFRDGDTLESLAALYGSDVDAIRQVNGLDESSVIIAGQNLVIPVRIPNVAPMNTAVPNTPIPPTEEPPQEEPTEAGGTDVEQPTEAPTEPPVSSSPGVFYIVRPGDSLSTIAAQFNTTVGELAELNGITNASQIEAGQQLTIIPASEEPTDPDGSGDGEDTDESTDENTAETYVVQPGDTLFGIAARFNISARALADANNLSNVNLIVAGQTLTIPQGE